MFNLQQYIELSASTVALDIESTNRFKELLQSLAERFQPQDLAEYLCVEEMAFAKWRLRRNIGFEHSLLDHQREKEQPLRKHLPPALQAALAFADDRPTQTTLHHRETSLRHGYTQSVRDLQTLRDNSDPTERPHFPTNAGPGQTANHNECNK